MKKETWVKKRHDIILALARIPFVPLSYIKYGIICRKFKEGRKRQFLILFNHQTAYDQFFVNMSFRCATYFLATEDIFSIGFLSKLLSFSCAPIPIKKQTTDLVALKNLIKVANEGGTIAIAPEGQRTYSGETTYINPAIVAMVKKVRLPIAFYRIEGGYGSQPRWSDVIRKGHITAGVTKVLEPEEYEKLSKEELLEVINKELYVNEACSDYTYKHRKLAERLERAVYYCPECGLSTFHSKDDTITCEKCKLTVRYLPTKELKGENEDFPYRFVLDWYNAQNAFVNTLELAKMTKEPLYIERINLSKVHIYVKKELLYTDIECRLYGDRLELVLDNEVKAFPFSKVKAITVLGKNKANLYYEGEVYQITGDVGFNALKYVNFFHRYNNLRLEKENDKFLGL